MRKVYNLFFLFLGKSALFIIQKFSLGAGSTLPGHIALFFNKHFIRDILRQNPNFKSVLITGTNGKTTSTKLLKYLLERNHYSVISNEAGANLINGIASSIVRDSDSLGRLKSKVGVFEIDEYLLALVAAELQPEAILVLNLFRDQLDRYGEVHSISARWKKFFSELKPDTALYLNGDDPELFYLGRHARGKVYYFGVDKKYMQIKKIPHDADSTYCPQCNEKLSYKAIAYSHLGNFRCKNCDFKHEKVETLSALDLKSNLYGQYSRYNNTGLILLLHQTFEISYEKIIQFLKEFKPAFGRQERIKYREKNIVIMLSKNPTGFNQSIAAVSEFKDKKINILLGLNDQIPDGRDISWIWDVDFAPIFKLSKKIFVSGDRGYDLALRLKYEFKKTSSHQKVRKNWYKAGNIIQTILPIRRAIREALARTNSDETLFILANYTAMLESREFLINRKFL